jgi:two-component system, LytTR family, response regulator
MIKQNKASESLYNKALTHMNNYTGELIRVLYITNSIDKSEKLQLLIESLPPFTYEGHALTAQEGIKMAQRLSPNLIFIDLELPDKDGFSVAKALSKQHLFIVFVSTDISLAMKAFEYAALDYLHKPISKRDLTRILERIEKLRHSLLPQPKNSLQDIITIVSKKIAFPQRILVNTTNQILNLHLANVVYINSNGSYTKFHKLNGELITSGKNMKAYAELIKDNPHFVRIHRSYIINMSHLLHIEKKKQQATFCFTNNIKIVVANYSKEKLTDSPSLFATHLL